MHTRITTVQIFGEYRVLQPTSVEESLALLQEKAIPKLKSQKGFVEALVLFDRSTNRVRVITVWETEDDMMALEASGLYRQIVGDFSDVVKENPRVEYFEVALHV